MNTSVLLRAIVGAVTFVLLSSTAMAQATVKVGVIAEFSGPFAAYGQQIEAGMKAYMKQHGDTVAGKKIELITRDTGGPAPDVAKRFAQELITRDKVQFLAGFGLTPNAMAVAPVVSEAKVPMIISNAATSAITTRSPYIARVSMTIPQVSAPMAELALKNGIKQVYTVVADYGPGIDAETQFTKSFKAGGGEVVGSLRTPLQNPDFSAAIQRVKDAKPAAVFVFLPAGEQGIAFVKGFNERGLAKEGIRLIATGDITDDHVLDAMGDPTLGLITSFHYSAAHDSAENKAFLANYAAANDPKVGRANFMAAAGYDTMAAIYEAVRKGGDTDPDKAMAALKGYKWMSPRGPVMIDPETRDIVQTVYIRKVEKKDGKLANVEFDKIENVKDPGKEAAK
ncbi:MAG: ABC transporter substrate-binding protein [Casimicrobiaceae bacterium]